jgi:hypothetical protein
MSPSGWRTVRTARRESARPGGRPLISRRRLLAAGGLLASLLAAGGMPHVAGAQGLFPKGSLVGRSRGGQPIVAQHLGGNQRRVLILGGQHGSPEANAVNVVDAILAHFRRDEGAIPKGIGLDVITIANPDGFIAGSRQYLSGVDPNRNWASGDWEPDAYDSLGRFWQGLGGPAPMSEPETRELAAWISRYRPALVVNYHSAGGFVSTGQDGLSSTLASAYADASGYPCFGPGDRAPFAYRITGAMDGWLAGRGIADLFVELTTVQDAEIEENLAGLYAVLDRLAAKRP